MALAKVKDKYQVTIPTDIRKQARLGVGDILEIVMRNSEIILRPKSIVDRVDAAVSEGLHDYRTGRLTKKFKSVKDFKHSLKR